MSGKGAGVSTEEAVSEARTPGSALAKVGTRMVVHRTKQGMAALRTEAVAAAAALADTVMAQKAEEEAGAIQEAEAGEGAASRPASAASQRIRAATNISGEGSCTAPHHLFIIRGKCLARGGLMGFVGEFMEFLNKHKVIGLAVAFIMGAAATDLVKSIVNDLVMPIVGVLTPAGEWQSAVLQIGPVKFMAGHFVGALINFVIIALVVFLLVKVAVKEEEKK